MAPTVLPAPTVPPFEFSSTPSLPRQLAHARRHLARARLDVTARFYAFTCMQWEREVRRVEEAMEVEVGSVVG